MIHKLKSWPALFEPAVQGKKSHDIRDGRDRNFQVGDFLHFQEFDPVTGFYTGREALFRVTYLTSQSIPCALSSAVLLPGYVILSIELHDALNSFQKRAA